MVYAQLFLFMSVIAFNASNQIPEVPYLPLESFQYELDYSFKTKPPPDVDYAYQDKVTVYKATPLPYVKMKFLVNEKLQKFYRVKVIDNNNKNIDNKKLKGQESFEVDMGYAVDIKDRISSYQFLILLFDEDKAPANKILVEFSEEGDMFINEKLVGRI